MYKSLVLRMYPNKENKEKINQFCGCARLVYNHYLEQIKNGKYPNKYEFSKDCNNVFKNEYLFLRKADSCAISNTISDLEENMKRCFNDGFGYPKFKSKFDKNSYTTNAIYGGYKENSYCNIKVDFKSHKIKLPKLDWIDFRGYRHLESMNGKIVNATITRTKTNKYYVSVTYEVLPLMRVENPTSVIGLDLGIKNLVTLSDCSYIRNEHNLEKYEKRIKRLQKELSRKEKGSNNYYKCKQRLARLYEKLRNARKYLTHAITKKITENYDIICCENLQTQNMVTNSQTKTLTKHITDASFGEIIRQLEYKCKFKGKYFYQVDKYYPSSQVCNVCGHRDKKYKDLSFREYECSECGSIIDRDLNASINIAFEGLTSYMRENFS